MRRVQPSNTNNYIAIEFKGTSDIVYISDKMFAEITQGFILKHKDTIQKICPGINFEIQ